MPSPLAPDASLAPFPGGDLIAEGLADRARLEFGSVPALLVAIAAPRLRQLGLDVPAGGPADPERALYERLAAMDARTAHGRYNALVRRLVSFARAYGPAHRAGVGSTAP